MKKVAFLVFIIVAGFIFQKALAQDAIDQQQVTINIHRLTSLDILGPNPSFDLQLNASNVLNDVVTMTEDRVSYSVVSDDGQVKRITVVMDERLPSGMFLWVYMAPPPDGTTTGYQVIETYEKDLIRDIQGTSFAKNVAMGYKLVVKTDAKRMSHIVRTITYTLKDQ